YRRWLGLGPATLGGGLFIVLPDNLRVALAEGNLPRTLATALLPLAVFLLLRALEPDGAPRHRAGLAMCLALIVLCHAMMAAIYAVCCALVTLGCLAAGIAGARRAVGALVALVSGIALSGWWLVPSLTGGITELNAAAMTEALATFPLGHYLDAAARAGNPEAIYLGLALLVLPTALLFVRAGRAPLPTVLTLVGLGAVLITTPGINDIYNSLPLHQLLWPLRFLGAASFFLLLALMLRLLPLLRHSRALGLAALALTALDFGGSLALVHTRAPAPDVAAIAERLAVTGGWRVATLDESRLGSAASYLFTARGGREQIFGWAYQGAHTAVTVAALNEAMQLGATAYLRDRLDLYGVDDVALLRALPAAPAVVRELAAAGFAERYAGAQAALYQRPGGAQRAARAVYADWRALGIGRGAQNLAYRFPQIVVGASPFLDDYSLDELRRYHTLALSGFAWRDRRAAEELVRAAAEAGVRVVVDLTGAPNDPLTGSARFLDVYAEPVILDRAPVVASGALGRFALAPLAASGDLWYTHTPQGAIAAQLSFDYLGQTAALVGRSRDAGSIWFVGLNLPYHAALTGDQAALTLLGDLLQLAPGATQERRTVPLRDYTAGHQGYAFRYTLDRPARLFVPLAAHEGIEVLVDGVPAPVTSYERLLAFDAPPGDHAVRVRVRRGPIYTLGQAVSAVAAVVTILMSGVGRQGLHPLSLSRARARGDQARGISPPPLVPQPEKGAGGEGLPAPHSGGQP
ncbi:MAG TPA: 6-pyruvoyl-tetrahydropterin synthase-related protein, partial [Roseiflexaceae bacterium]|nr:6-pyruvoyl-tetrahydropterin synthase-related protein [Roseiflexaceae bacterium]